MKISDSHIEESWKGKMDGKEGMKRETWPLGN